MPSNTTVRKYFTELNLDPPAAYLVTEEIDRAIKATAASNPIDTLAADLEAGKVTAKQAAARVAETARLLSEKDKAHQVAQGLAQTIDTLYRRALRDAGDTVIEQLRPQFDDAVATIVSATEILGTNPTDEQVGALGPAAAVAWDQRKAAAGTLATVHRLRGALAQSGYGTPAFTVAWYTTDATPPALEQATRTFGAGGEGLVNLAAFGIGCNLNDATRTETITRGVSEARALAEAQTAAAKATATRVHHDWQDLADETRAKATS